MLAAVIWAPAILHPSETVGVGLNRRAEAELGSGAEERRRFWETGMTSGTGDDAAALEARPSGDFIDGYLAALASLNAALAGAPAHSFFYSFDWIGAGDEERLETLHAAFQSTPETMSFEVREAPNWREALAELGRKWLARYLPERSAGPLATEFVELLEAFLGDEPVTIYRVRPVAPDSGAPMRPAIGSDHDHLLFETIEGRLILEFSTET